MKAATKKNQNEHAQPKTIFMVLLIALFTISIYAPNVGVLASKEDELRKKAEDLQAQIDANEAVLDELASKEVTLKARLSGIETEVAQISAQIELTEVEVERLGIEIEKNEAELARQEQLLADSMRELYKRGDITTLEMLAASDSFSEFINEQEYLERVKEGIQASTEKIEELKAQLETEKDEQETLLAKQEAQQRALQAKRSEQQQLIAETQGEEARYQDIVADLEEQRKQAEKELNDYLASLQYTGNYVSLGRVQTGDIIGYVGNTGYSFGAHLHFEVRSGSSAINPVSGGEITGSMAWPLPYSDWGDITQYYGCQFEIVYYNACSGGGWLHTGLDVSGASGDPVIAPANGDIIFNGWFGGYGNMVIIQHDNGYTTAFAHLLD